MEKRKGRAKGKKPRVRLNVEKIFGIQRPVHVSANKSGAKRRRVEHSRRKPIRRNQ